MQKGFLNLVFFLFLFDIILTSDIMIYNCSQIDQITSSNNYYLAQDLDCPSLFGTINFSHGILEGGNHKISNLQRMTGGGLFATTTNVTISNLRIENMNVTSNVNYFGGLVDTATNTTILNVSLTVNNSNTIFQPITSSGHVGGMIGYSDSTTIINCTIENLRMNLSSNSECGGYSNFLFERIINFLY